MDSLHFVWVSIQNTSFQCWPKYRLIQILSIHLLLKSKVFHEVTNFLEGYKRRSNRQTGMKNAYINIGLDSYIIVGGYKLKKKKKNAKNSNGELKTIDLTFLVWSFLNTPTT